MANIEQYKPGLSKNQALVDQLKEFQRNPKSLVFVSLADNYRDEGLFQQALDILDEGLEHHPHLMMALVARARCLFDLKRYAEAMQQIQVVIQLNPQNLKAYKLQSEIYVRLGQRKAAIRALTKVILLYPQDMEATRALQELEAVEMQSKQPAQKAQAQFLPREAPVKAGKIEEFQVSTVQESFVSLDKQIEQSQEILDQSEEDDDGVEPAFATRTIAELYLRQGLKRKAKKVLRQILKDDPTHSWARETLQVLGTDGIVLPTQKKVDKHQEELEKRAKVLETMLARVRLLKGASA